MPDFAEISQNIVYFITTNLEKMYITSGSLIKNIYTTSSYTCT